MQNLSQERLLAELRALRPQFERDGILHMSLFGSRARQDHRLDSDIDLLVDLVPNDRLSLLDLIGIGHRVEDRVGVPTQIVLRRSAPDDFLQAVAADQIAVF